MDADKSSSPSLDHSDIDDVMIVAEESSLNSSRKRKLPAEESDLLPLPKHFCLEQKQASLAESSWQSSVTESGECSYAMEDTKTGDETSSSAASVTGATLYMSKDSSYSTGSSSWSGYATSSIDQCCSKGNDKTEEYVEDMEFICPEFAVEDLQDSEEAIMKPTIDQEFEEYFSTLMM